MSVELATIFRRHGPAYIKRYGQRMPARQLRALLDIIECRTAALGGHRGVCLRCNTRHHFFHSCGNRCCPQCQSAKTAEWIARRRSELLPVPYFHLVFTLPSQLRALVRCHQRVLLGLLMRTAAQAIMDLAKDPRYVGGQVGVMAVLHTWSQTLMWHTHVHCLVTGGGLAEGGDGEQSTWRSARPSYLVPVKALSKRFRGAFIAGLRRLLPEQTVPKSVFDKPWVVYAKPGLVGDERVLTYLGRYVHRVAISNNRIVAADDTTVSFRYRDSRDDRLKTMRLPAFELMRRFLQHVPPKRFHRVRYYGLWSPPHRKRLIWIRAAMLLAARTTPEPEDQPSTQDAQALALMALLRRLRFAPLGCYRCPNCGGLVVIVDRVFPKMARAPPQWRALRLGQGTI
jgi:hypothetical protein